MKRYRLLKPLPDAVIGDVYLKRYENGDTYVNEQTLTQKIPVIEHNSYFSWQVENNPEWFAEITDTPEQTTKEGFVWDEIEKAIINAGYVGCFSENIKSKLFKAPKQSKSNTPKEEGFEFSQELPKEIKVDWVDTAKEELLDLANPNPKYSFPPSYQPKEEQPSKEWEIVSFKIGSNIWIRENIEKEYFNVNGRSLFERVHQNELPIDAEIHSVRRLSDQNVFNIDEITKDGKIVSFEPYDEKYMSVKLNMLGCMQSMSIEHLQKLPSTKPAEQPIKEDRIEPKYIVNDVKLYTQEQLDKVVERARIDAFWAGKNGDEYFKPYENAAAYLSTIKNKQ